MWHAYSNAYRDGDGYSVRNTLSDAYVPTRRFPRAVDAGRAGSH
jgi:hypothetical protein